MDMAEEKWNHETEKMEAKKIYSSLDRWYKGKEQEAILRYKDKVTAMINKLEISDDKKNDLIWWVKRCPFVVKEEVVQALINHRLQCLLTDYDLLPVFKKFNDVGSIKMLWAIFAPSEKAVGVNKKALMDIWSQITVNHLKAIYAKFQEMDFTYVSVNDFYDDLPKILAELWITK